MWTMSPSVMKLRVCSPPRVWRLPQLRSSCMHQPRRQALTPVEKEMAERALHKIAEKVTGVTGGLSYKKSL